MDSEKNLMAEAAVLYYEKKLTQQEIAQILGLSRQTVSKLLNDAITEHIVEIKVHAPDKTCNYLEQSLCKHFQIKNAVVCSVSGKDNALRQLMTAKQASTYLTPILKQGNLKIAVSWGRTLQTLIEELPQCYTEDNIVFPLFGATDSDQSYFLSNELTRNFANKIGATAKYAWFPYRPDQVDDCELLKRTSYYQKIDALWQQMDLAIVGIGNTSILRMFENVFDYPDKSSYAVGDIATKLFTLDGTLIESYNHALCASAEDIRRAKQTVAIACSNAENDKIDAIIGALRTGLIDTLITDEHTAQKVVDRVSPD